MNTLPFLQKLVAALDHVCHQSSLVRLLDTDKIDGLRFAIRSRQVDFACPDPVMWICAGS